MRSGGASNVLFQARRETRGGTARITVCLSTQCSGSRAGAPWRDLPPAFGNWNSVFQRFRRWAKKGVWERIFNALVESPDFEYLIIDSTIVRAHQHAAGAKGGAKMRQSGVRVAA